MNITNNETVSYEKALRYSIFLGWLGVDRFYMGDNGIGALKLCTFIYIVPWLIDIAVIYSHKDNWDEWVSVKQEKRASKKKTKEDGLAIKELRNDRAANGKCPECESSNLTAVSETTNKLSVTGALIQLTKPNQFVPNDKIVSKIKRVCLNCGYQF